MRVLLFSDVQRKGGAGIAAHRLTRALIGYGHDVLWATPYPDTGSDIPTVNCREWALGDRAARRIALTLKPGQKQAVDTQAVIRRLRQVIREYRPDVINVHNLHGADLPATLPAELSRTTPVVWTLHDMWAFTGTCAYSMDCRAFETACTAECPLAEVYPASSSSSVPLKFAQRQKAFGEAGRIAFVTPSRWLADEASKGILGGHDVRAIANSVELDQFKPIDRGAAREALELPQDRPVVVTAARIDDPRKGAAVLFDALGEFDRPETILLQLGGYEPDVEGRVWEHRVLKGMHDPRLLRLAYSAADVHVLPTLADNLPNTLLEAAACGVPSIATDVGGVGEAIDYGKTGWLIEPGDVDGLARQIGRVLNESEPMKKQRRTDCRHFAEANFAPELQAKRYTELFEGLVVGRSGATDCREAA